MNWNFNSIVKFAIQYLSDAVKFVEPADLADNDKENLQDILLIVYGAVVGLGKKLAAKSTNDLDDAVVNELIQICQEAATKYGLTLDATKV